MVLKNTLLSILSLIAGLFMLITPEYVPTIVIRIIGLIWIIEGLEYALNAYTDYLKNKKR